MFKQIELGIQKGRRYRGMSKLGTQRFNAESFVERTRGKGPAKYGASELKRSAITLKLVAAYKRLETLFKTSRGGMLLKATIVAIQENPFGLEGSTYSFSAADIQLELLADGGRENGQMCF